MYFRASTKWTDASPILPAAKIAPPSRRTLPDHQAANNPDTFPECRYFELASSHQLAYTIFGQADGFPVFYFHSTGSSRLECALFHDSARRLGYQLIAIDRPGIGGSDYRPNLELTDIARDVLALANGLNIKQFGVMSFSTGGIFALTTAFHCPSRVSFQLSLGGIQGNLEQDFGRRVSYFTLFTRTILPGLVRLATRLKHAMVSEDSGKYIQRLHERLNYTDRKILANPAISKILTNSMEESIVQGFQGVAQDTGLSFARPQFQLHQVKVPVSIWQGCADNLNSRSTSEYLAARIPSASFHSVANRGHFFFVHCMDEIFVRTRQLVRSNSCLA